jgi:hypothetical protein
MGVILTGKLSTIDVLSQFHLIACLSNFFSSIVISGMLHVVLQGMQPQQTAPPTAQQPGPQPGAATQNGQPDYSAQWAEYYRSIGKVKEAEAIEAQMKAAKVN